MIRFVNSLLWVAPLCVVAIGCGDANPSPTSTEKPVQPAATNKEVTLKKVGTEKLTPLGDYLRPEDGGHIEAAPPKGWIPKVKGKDYLYAFVKDKNAKVPSILVKSIDPIGGEEFGDVTEENVVEYAAKVRSSVSGAIESPLPIVIGKNAFARYVKEFLIEGASAEVQVLTTNRGGRAYSVELRVRPQELKKHRDAAYAVAAGLKFSADAKPFEFKPEIVPPETPPAETPPAAAPPAAVPPAAAPPAAAPPATPTTPPGENK